MRTVTMLGFIILGKCVNNEMILKLNENHNLLIAVLICVVADLIYFFKKMDE